MAKKAPAKKPAGKRAQSPSKPAKKAAPARTPKTASKAVREPVRAVQDHPEGWMGEGSVSLVGPGRIRWECRKLEGGIGVRLQPSGVRVDTRRISLTFAFKHPPTGATSDSFQPKVEDRLVQLQFLTFPGWEEGFSVEFHGVDEVPEIS